MAGNRACTAAPRNRRWGFDYLAIVAVCLGVGVYAVSLNRMVYQHRQPIYDSMSYYTKLHRVMSTARYEGVPDAVGQTCQGANTVALPLLVAAMLGRVAEPDRAIGVWIQVGQLLLLSCLLVRYWRLVVGLRSADAVLLTMPVIGMACLYYDQGGLADFRMDLGLMLMYGATCLAYLVARHRRRAGDYWVLGVVAGLSLLCRATAPAYLLLALGPLALIDLGLRLFSSPPLRGRGQGEGAPGLDDIPSGRGGTWKHEVKLLGRSVLAASLVGGWFYVLNYEYLHYYYVVWNTDANARLPWSSSIRHLEFALKHIGLAAGVWLVLAAVVIGRPPGDAPVGAAASGQSTLWDWRLVWIGLAPLAGLVMGGAGHNPFVSMPAALGIYLALVRPLAVRLGHLLASKRRVALWVVTMACLGLAMYRGYTRHQPGPYRSMAAHHAILQTLLADAQRRGESAVSYGALHMNQMDATSLQNVLLFDTPNCHTQIARTIWEGVQLMPNLTFFRPAESDWRDVSGNSDEEKIATLIGEANDRLDYLVIPELESVDKISKTLPHFVGNRHLAALRERIVESKVWQPISEPHVVGPLETVRLWRNVARGN